MKKPSLRRARIKRVNRLKWCSDNGHPEDKKFGTRCVCGLKKKGV